MVDKTSFNHFTLWKFHLKLSYTLGMLQVYGKGALTPMNKFACKFRGYIIYFNY